MTWIMNNGGTIIVSLLLAVIVAAIVIRIVRDRKNGKSSCGCHCASCAMSMQCHKNN